MKTLPLSAALLLLAACGRSDPPPAPGPVPPVASPAGSLAARTPDGEPWWRHAVVYEVFVRSFADASTGPLADDGVGDLRGLAERLDYLNDGDARTTDDLGVDALWLMPILESPSYHGYDVRDYRAVEEDYGTLADFRHLVAEAHRRGVRVILDLVLNHTSRRHPWFRDAWREDSPYHGWYVWSDAPKGYRGPWGQRVWHQLPWWQRGFRRFGYRAYYGIFSRHMPDLDHTEPAVEAAMHQVSRFWLEQGASGFRLDAVRHLVEDGAVQEDTPATHAWLRRYQRFLDRVDPEAVTVGEVWDDLEVTASYGADELDLTFQFELADDTLEAVIDGLAAPYAETLAATVETFPGGRFATFLTNHDQVRVMSRLDGDEAGARLAAVLLLTGPGVPFVYYGEEIGMTGRKPDPEIRTPMQWSGGRWAGFSGRRPWQDPRLDADERHVEGQAHDPASLLSLYRRLIHLRRDHRALRTGECVVLATGHAAVHAHLRRDAASGEAFLVLVNLARETVDAYALDIDALDVDASGLRPVRELLHGGAVADGADLVRPVGSLAPRTAWLFALGQPEDAP